MKTRRLLNKRGKGGGLGEDLGAIEKWDKPQPLSSDDKAFDAVFLHGVAMDGYYLAMGVDRKHGAKANALIYLVVSSLRSCKIIFSNCTVCIWGILIIRSCLCWQRCNLTDGVIFCLTVQDSLPTLKNKMFLSLKPKRTS